VGHGVRLGDDLEEIQFEVLGDALEGAQVDERRERVEDTDLDVAALEADRVRNRVAVDLSAGDGGVDETDIDLCQARLPGNCALGFTQGFALDTVDEALQLGFGDHRVGPLALL